LQDDPRLGLRRRGVAGDPRAREAEVGEIGGVAARAVHDLARGHEGLDARRLPLLADHSHSSGITRPSPSSSMTIRSVAGLLMRRTTPTTPYAQSVRQTSKSGSSEASQISPTVFGPVRSVRIASFSGARLTLLSRAS